TNIVPIRELSLFADPRSFETNPYTLKRSTVVLPLVRRRGDVEGPQALRRLATLVTSKAYKAAQQKFLCSKHFFASPAGSDGKRVSTLQVADGILFGIPVFYLARLRL
ncbi:MAG: hypothetical protein LC781_11125, partial [Actinobacteria bacterium]|nr:hypothetical protein [Actinomycetota bacterium]